MNGLAKLLQFSMKRFFCLQNTSFVGILMGKKKHPQAGYPQLWPIQKAGGWGPTSAAEEQMPLLNTDGFQV